MGSCSSGSLRGLPGFEPRPLSLLALGPWASHFTFFVPQFFAYKKVENDAYLIGLLAHSKCYVTVVIVFVIDEKLLLDF